MPGDAPIQVRRAIGLLWASLIIGALSTIPAWEPLPEEVKEFETWLWGVMAFSLAVPALLIFFVSRRKNWARVLLLLLTLFGVASYLAFPTELGSEPGWSVAVTVLVTALDFAALYWLFSKPGSEWFACREVTSAV